MMGFLKTAELFRNSWHLYRKYYSQKKNAEMWEQFVEEAEGLYEKYGKQPFAKEMIMAVICEIERIDKEQKHFTGGKHVS